MSKRKRNWLRSRWRAALRVHGVPLVVMLLLSGCQTRQQEALQELTESGIEVSGRSLLRAVTGHDLERTALLLEAGVYTETRDTRGRTPLAVAVESQDADAAFMLLNAHANVNATSEHQTCILGIAMAQGNEVMTKILLGSGARTEGLMPDGEKILPWAIREGRLKLVESMMQTGSDPHLKDQHGNPLLHVAMEAGRRDLMTSLVKLGADPGATNAAGETTIQLALRQGWVDAIPMLAAAGADPNAPSRDGRTLLEKAVDEENLGLAALLLKIGADANHRQNPEASAAPLRHVFESHSPVLFEVFLNHGAKPASGNWDPWLWQTFMSNDLAKARILLAHGARDSLFPTHHLHLVEAAAMVGETDFLKLLLDYGFDAGSALYRAASRGDHDVVSLLLAEGVSPRSTRIPTLDTALSVAIRNGHDRVAVLLLEHGADTGLRLPEGQSAFHLAVARGCYRTVRQLISAGANPNAPFAQPVSPDFLRLLRPGVMRWVLKMDRNITPLMVAVDSGHLPTAQTLLKAGAKTSTWTRFTELWPMNFATSRSDVRMIRLLLRQDPYHEERVIEIRLSEQRARMYDHQGNEIFSTKVSTGRPGFSTRTGEFAITDKYRDWTSTIYHASMPYFQRLSCSDFGMHQGYVPNYPASHGCIRVPAANAAKLFSLTQTGDRVRILP